jgi:predicted GNAT family N-acyltransferase
MIIAEMVHGLDGLDIQYKIRDEVFTEEQGISKEISHDEYDPICHHVIVSEDKVPIGTGRIINIEQKNALLIGRIAVLKSHRGQGIGDLIVRKLVCYGFDQGVERVEVHSQLYAIDFYKKIGFEPYGSIYKESGLDHISMYITQDMFKKPCNH